MRRAAFVASGLVLVLTCALPVHSADPDGRRASPGAYSSLPLRVLKVDERSITVKSALVFADRPAPEPMTFAIDPEVTRVFATVVTGERVDENGRRVTSGKFRPATLAELEVGQQVNIGADDDDVAVDIIIRPPPPGRGAKPKDGKPAEKK